LGGCVAKPALPPTHAQSATRHSRFCKPFLAHANGAHHVEVGQPHQHFFHAVHF
jgi:hypothetical protein